MWERHRGNKGGEGVGEMCAEGGALCGGKEWSQVSNAERLWVDEGHKNHLQGMWRWLSESTVKA